MVRDFACPGCGESEELTGKPSPEGIRIHCGRCDTSWLRDAEPEKCVTCGGADIVQHQRALTQYSRGTQLSIVGLVPISLCRACDRRMVEWSETQGARCRLTIDPPPSTPMPWRTVKATIRMKTLR